MQGVRLLSAAVLLFAAAALPLDPARAQNAPAKPTGFTTDIGNTQVRLRWTGPDDSTITGWQYAYKSGSDSYGAWTAIPGSDSNTRRYAVTGLENGTVYTFKIRAVNAVGPSRESDEKTGYAIAVGPEAPTSFQISPGDGTAALTWDHADDVSIVGWEYRQRTSSGSYGFWFTMLNSDADTTSYTVGDLENGTEYWIKIRAWNRAGNGYESDEASVTPMASAPGKPTGFSVTAGDSKAILTWDDPQNDTITKWQYVYGTTGANGVWTDIADSGARTVRHEISMLQNGTEYNFRIRAINDVGNGVQSDEVSATPAASKPEKPTGLVVLAGDGQAVLEWTDPSDATIKAWQYQFKTAGAYGSWTDIPASNAKTTRHTVSGLDNGAEHTFRIRSENDTGHSPESDEASATPLAVPAKPSGFTAMAGDARVTLGWSDPQNATITGWQYSFKTSGDYGAWTSIDGSDASTTAHIVTGLSNGAEHVFRIRAVNDSGYGTESDTAAATPRPVPAKPAGLRAEAGNGEVRLAWTDPDDATITGWQYRVKTTGAFGQWTDIAGSGAATTAYTLTGLNNGTTYSFRLRAVNGSGAGPESDEASAAPLAPPAAPSGLRAAPGDGQVVLTWDDPSDATITGWQYRVKTTDAFGQWTDIAGSGAATTAYTLTGLDNGTTYSFRLRAVNGSGAGPESDEASAVPLAPPAAPSGLRAAPGDRQVVLTWDDPGDSSITGWQYGVKTAGAFGQWTDIPGSGAGTTAYTLTGLDNGTTYSFRLRAVNGSGPGPESDEASAAPLAPPAAPSGFRAAPGDGQVVLTWDDPGDSSITGWQYGVKTAGAFGQWTDIPGSGAATTAYTLTGLDNGTTYSFRLRAVNAGGNGAQSGEASAVPLPVPAKPTGLTATPGDGQVVLEWDDPQDSTITGWEYNRRLSDGAWEPYWTFIVRSGATTTRHRIIGLESAGSYVFKIRAVNAVGASVESDEASAAPIAVPAKPTGFTAVPGDERVTLGWDDPDDATITGWQYSTATVGAHGGWADIPDSDATTTGHVVTGLDNGTAYRFKLRAVSGSGFGRESDEAAAVPFALPAKPTGLVATPGSGRVLLEWDDPEDPAITGWEYNQRRAGGEFEKDWTYILGSGTSTTSHTVIGLEIGASYGFKIRAVAGSRASPESDEAAASLPSVPGKPSGLAATPGAGEALLEWAALDDPTVTLWQYSYRTDGGHGAWTDMSGSGATTTSHRVTGLKNGAAHNFRIRAANANGFGLESDEAMAVPFAVPDRPAGLKAVAGDRSVLLQWSNPNDPEIDGWEYNQKPAGGEFEEYWTHILGSRAATTHHLVNGLENGIDYAFKLRAIAGSRIGQESDEVTARPGENLPAAPQNLRARPGDSQAELLWDDPENPAITGWQYRYRTTGDFTAWRDIPNGGPALTSHIVTGLANGTAHFFQLRAQTASGFGLPSETASVSPEWARPAKPTGLAAVAGDGQVLLTWDATNDPAAHWEYVRWIDDAGQCVDGGNAWEDAGDAAATRYTATGLTNGVSYCFQVRLARGVVSGPASDPVSATPRAIVGAAERRVAQAALAGFVSSVAAGAEAMIGTRFSARPAAPRFVLAGQDIPLFASAPGQQAQGPVADGQRPVGMRAQDALRTSAFRLPFGPPGDNGVPQWSLWHRSGLQDFEGTPAPQARYGGRSLSAWFGVDLQWNEAWLAGVALARSEGEADYATEAGAGVLEMTLNSVHPYLQRRFRGGETVWLALGGGRGAVENRTVERGVETANTDMTMASAGFRRPLPDFRGVGLSLTGAAGFAALETDGDAETAIGSLSTSVDRQKLGIEAALDDGEISRHASIALRRDGGDGAAGFGVELAAGIGAPLPVLSAHMDVGLRWLARHSDRGYREFGLSAAVRRPLDASGAGLSWSLAAARGAPEDGPGNPGMLWSDNEPERPGGQAAALLDARAGWGFVSRKSVFMPHAALGLDRAAARRLAFGLDMGPLSGPTLKLAAERRIPQSGNAENRVTSALQFRF